MSFKSLAIAFNLQSGKKKKHLCASQPKTCRQQIVLLQITLDHILCLETFGTITQLSTTLIYDSLGLRCISSQTETLKLQLLT